MFHKLQKYLFTPIVTIKAKCLATYLLPYLKPNQVVLDVGCGDGLVTHHLIDRCPHIDFIGLDVFDYRLNHIPFNLYDGTQFPYQDNQFDCTMAIFSLHHCEDETAVISEMLRTSNHLVILVEEIYTNWFEKLYLYAHDWVGNRLESGTINIPFHFHSIPEWSNLISKHHGCVIHTQPIQQYPWWLNLLLLTYTKQRLLIIEKQP